MPFSIMPSKSTRPSFFSLKVDDDDLKEQLDEYETLKITKSYRENARRKARTVVAAPPVTPPVA